MDIRDFIKQCNNPGEFLEDEKISRLEEISKMTWKDFDGNEQPFLNDDEVLGAFVHLLFTEGEALFLADKTKILENLGNVRQLAGLHLVQVLLVATLPVLVRVDIAVPENLEEPLDLTLLTQRAKPHQVEVVLRNHHFRRVRKECQVVVGVCYPVDHAVLDLLDEADSVVRVHHFLTNLECHGSPFCRNSAKSL